MISLLQFFLLYNSFRFDTIMIGASENTNVNYLSRGILRLLHLRLRWQRQNRRIQCRRCAEGAQLQPHSCHHRETRRHQEEGREATHGIKFRYERLFLSQCQVLVFLIQNILFADIKKKVFLLVWPFTQRLNKLIRIIYSEL